MTKPAIVLFDGFCNFCDASVQFMIANDPHGRFRFAASQSDAGQAALRAAGITEPSLGSIVLIDDDGVHVKSDATLRIVAGLRFPWSLAALARAIPRAAARCGLHARLALSDADLRTARFVPAADTR